MKFPAHARSHRRAPSSTLSTTQDISLIRMPPGPKQIPSPNSASRRRARATSQAEQLPHRISLRPPTPSPTQQTLAHGSDRSVSLSPEPLAHRSNSSLSNTKHPAHTKHPDGLATTALPLQHTSPHRASCPCSTHVALCQTPLAPWAQESSLPSSRSRLPLHSHR